LSREPAKLVLIWLACVVALPVLLVPFGIGLYVLVWFGPCGPFLLATCLAWPWLARRIPGIETPGVMIALLAAISLAASIWRQRGRRQQGRS